MKRADAVKCSSTEPEPCPAPEELQEGQTWVIMQHIEAGQSSQKGFILPFHLLDTWVIPGRILEGQVQPIEAQWMATKWQGASWDSRRIQVITEPIIIIHFVHCFLKYSSS